MAISGGKITCLGGEGEGGEEGGEERREEGNVKKKKKKKKKGEKKKRRKTQWENRDKDLEKQEPVLELVIRITRRIKDWHDEEEKSKEGGGGERRKSSGGYARSGE